MGERIAIIDGLRTPMAKAGTALAGYSADDLGAWATRALLARNPMDPADIDEVIIGNVAQPPDAANVARVIALKAGVPRQVPAMTVHRNCASGMESITTAAERILSGSGGVYLAGGTESMSKIPLLFRDSYAGYMLGLAKAKNPWQRLGAMGRFKFSMLKPIIGLTQGLTDPVSGLIMGLTAENLSREFGIDREAQDAYALESHEKALAAEEAGIMAAERIPIPAPGYGSMITADVGPRKGQSMAALAKLKPFFDRKTGTVTVGNSCPVTDGAAMVLIMAESEAKRRGLEPLGYLRSWAYASLEPERMGLGPVYATAKLMEKDPFTMDEIDVVEMNEAFAAQILANVEAFGSTDFAQRFLGRSEAVGKLNMDRFNPRGGAVALGHPVGMTGTRLVIRVLQELKQNKWKKGLATLCVGGGQGASLLLEAA